MEMRMRRTVTFPFFREQVGFADMDATHKAKYLLFFVTEVVRLRHDGMEPCIIAERLADVPAILGDPQYKEMTKREIIDKLTLDITQFFQNRGDRGEIIDCARHDGIVAYKINPNNIDTIYEQLYSGIKVFVSYRHTFQHIADAISKALNAVGVMPWLYACKPGERSVEIDICNAINDSCLVVFLITPDFKNQTWINAEIRYALYRFSLYGGKSKSGEGCYTPQRFNILPIIVHIEGKADGAVPDELGPYPQKTVNSDGHIVDAQIVKYIVDAMPLSLGVSRWKQESS